MTPTSSKRKAPARYAKSMVRASAVKAAAGRAAHRSLLWKSIGLVRRVAAQRGLPSRKSRSLVYGEKVYEVALEPRAALMMAENAEPTLSVGHGTAAAPRAARRNATCRLSAPN